MDKEKLKTYGSIVVILIALFLAFQFFVNKDSNSPLLLEVKTNGASTELVKDLFSILEDVNRIKLDTTLFEDPLYANLTDFSVTLIAQERGRKNPFAPLEGSGGIVSKR